MHNTISRGMFWVLILAVSVSVLVGGGFFLYWRAQSLALQTGEIISTDYNDAHSCYAQTIRINLAGKMNPLSKNIFYLLHSQLYYRIFRQDGTLINSTVWRFFEPTVEGDSARWINNTTLVYPADGYKSLNAEECG